MKKEKQIFEAALYLRLSKENLNEEIGQSDSIANQEVLLRAFVKAHPEIHIRHVFKDDGWSGVNFDRPGFQKMMQMVYDGKINCIVVKDLSRLGRNHTETGKYISRVFPAFGVRFIAVNDNVDTYNQNDDLDHIIIPFKDLLNDSYSRDISIKIRSTLEMKRQQGLFVGSRPRFGYMKDPKDKNKLVIDEEAAVIVRKVFQWTIDGMGNTMIARKLNDMHFPAPAEYRELKQEGKKAVSGKKGWYPIAINRMLRDDTYIGVLTQGKITTPNYKVKKVVHKAPGDAVRVEHAFEPIISEEEFYLVQRLLEKDVRSAPGQEFVYPLCGFLYCGDCGGSMIRHTIYKNGKTYQYYVCGEHIYNKEVCFPHQIGVKQLDGAVLEAMNLHLQMLFEVDDYLQTARTAPLQNRDVEQYQLQIARAIEQKQKFLWLGKDCYRDYKDGILTEREYRDMKAEYEAAAQDADKTAARLELEKQKALEKKQLDVSWVQEFREKGRIDAITRRTVLAMVERVEVYPGKHIKVIFRFEDEIQDIYGLLHPGQKEA